MAIRRVSWNVEDLKKSSKAARMLDIIEDAKEENRKVIVFSYFLDTIAAVEKLVNGGGSSEAVSEVAGVASGAKGALSGNKCMEAITGSVTPQRRQEILDEFEKAPAGTVLPAQIQSGGTGLNIQAASVVIICEPQLKPSIENQAISRAYRMGQTRSVLVFRLVCENSVDERIMEMLASKQSEFDIFADRSDAAAESIEIDSKTQGEIIRAEQERLEQEK
jgi:SNF2 family DNA or RNA helicase